MASIPYLLMTEFYAEAKAAGDNYDRKFVFSDAEGMVNNYLHGRTPAECIGFTRKAIVSWSEDSSRTEAEREALADALIIIDLFAEQYELTLEK